MIQGGRSAETTASCAELELRQAFPPSRKGYLRGWIFIDCFGNSCYYGFVEDVRKTPTLVVEQVMDGAYIYSDPGALQLGRCDRPTRQSSFRLHRRLTAPRCGLFFGFPVMYHCLIYKMSFSSPLSKLNSSRMMASSTAAFMSLIYSAMSPSGALFWGR
jgi:hypothetical protein